MIKSIVVHHIPMSYIAAMERWYYRNHAPEINRRFGPWLVRHDSYLPVDSVLHDWDRVIELWYESFDDWHTAIVDRPPNYTRPDWATTSNYPFVEPFKEFVSSFILERPNDEFWRDSRGYL